jgi:hypothetical protein
VVFTRLKKYDQLKQGHINSSSVLDDVVFVYGIQGGKKMMKSTVIFL